MSFINNSQKLEKTLMYINRKWIKNVIYLYNRIVLSNKKKQTTLSVNTMGKPHIYNPEWKNLNSKA